MLFAETDEIFVSNSGSFSVHASGTEAGGEWVREF
jgi:hypothetical protein